MAGKSLGTAWIQIKPTTKDISKELKDELTKVEKELTGGKFQSIFSGLGKNIQDTFTSAFKKVSSTAKTMLTAGIGGAVGLIGSSVDSAVSRLDTLNNAPRVFSAMGYAAEDVSTSMGILNEYLNGLPTTLDGAVRNVQLLSASFGGIKNGTKYFQALNNAGLAFGASTDMIENAIMQLSQTSLDGPLDAATWNSLRNSGFSPVFAAMAKEANMTVGQLKEDFGGDGTKTVQDFLDSLVKLNDEGGAGMTSLAEMARANTDGIRTSFTNAKTAITRGAAEIVSSIPNFSSTVITAGKSVEKVLKGTMGIDEAAANINNLFVGMAEAISGVLGKVVPLVLKTLPNLVETVVGSLVNFLSDEGSRTQLIQGFVQLFVAVAKAGSEIAMVVLPMIPELIGTICSEIMKPENIGTLAAGAGLLFGYAFGKSIGTNIFKTSVTKLGNLFKSQFGRIFSAKTVEGEVDKVSVKIGNKFKGIGNTLANVIKGIAAPIQQAISSVGEILKTTVMAVMDPIKALLQGVGEAIKGFFVALADPMIVLGAAMFALAAGSIAFAILAIGGAIGVVMPALTNFFNGIIIPVADFIATTLISLLETVSSIIVSLTQGALIPLIEILSGSFVAVIRTVGDLVTNVIKASLEGLASVVAALGDGFLKMGEAIKLALEGVQGVLSAFADLIKSIAAAAVAIVAMVTGHSIEYGNGYARIDGYALGGRVFGAGTATSDSIPAMLSDGEYVIRASAAQKIGYDRLDSLNETGQISNSQTVYININGYNKSPEELANIISRKVAFKTQGVLA